jgi:nucleoside-diphosphate-sugar epimerase
MQTNPRTVLILGAQGRFGRAAVHAFAAAGWRVLAQVRRTPQSALPTGASWLPIALDDTNALCAQAAGASVVVYAVNPVYTAWREQLLPLARLGMDAAERLNARFMLPGNIYNFGAGMPALLNENTPQQPSTVKGRLRCDLEAEMAAREGLTSVVLRAGDFFGAGRGSWFDLVITKSIQQGKLVYPGPLELPHAWAYLPDLAQAFVALAQVPAAARFERLHFAGYSLTGTQWLAAIEEAARGLGLQRARGFRHGAMPWRVIRFAGLVLPMWRELAAMAYLWQRPHALDGTRLAQRVGALATTPLPLALRRSLIELGLGHEAAR